MIEPVRTYEMVPIIYNKHGPIYEVSDYIRDRSVKGFYIYNDLRDHLYDSLTRAKKEKQ